MKRFLILILLAVAGCQTASIHDKKYKVSNSITELGSIGFSNTGMNFKNSFDTRTFPLLKNKIRLNIEVLPFNKDLNTVYLQKMEIKGEQPVLQYNDSIRPQPQYALITILDVSGYLQEINADYNTETYNFIKDTKDAYLVKEVAISLSTASIDKIKEADAYYLINDQEKKYTIALLKQGKQFDTLDINPGIPLVYSLGKFCWAENERHRWYIADIIDEKGVCKGNTSENIKEKEETNLFKM